MPSERKGDDGENQGTDVLLVNDPGCQNAWRADRGFDLTLAALRPFAKEQLINWYNALLEQLVTHNGAQVALKDLPVCTQHARMPGDGKPRVKIATLNNCSLCGHWIKALGAAHLSGNVNKLAAANLYPSMWRDPDVGWWSIAMAFTQGGYALDIGHADITCLVNVMVYCKGAFSMLSADDIEHLQQLPKYRNVLAHRSPRRLTTPEMQDCIGACVTVLEAGPWTAAPFATATAEALEAVKGWRDTPMKLMPSLEPLPPHYLPQPKPLE